jgi:hypothetical protein
MFEAHDRYADFLANYLAQHSQAASESAIGDQPQSVTSAIPSSNENHQGAFDLLQASNRVIALLGSRDATQRAFENYLNRPPEPSAWNFDFHDRYADFVANYLAQHSQAASESAIGDQPQSASSSSSSLPYVTAKLPELPDET